MDARTADMGMEVADKSLTVSRKVKGSLRVHSDLMLPNGKGPAVCHYQHQC